MSIVVVAWLAGWASAARSEETGDAGSMIKAATERLTRSRMSYVEVARQYWDPDKEVPLTAIVSPVPSSLMPDELKGNWDKIAAALARAKLGAGHGYALRLAVREEGAREAAWEGRSAIDPAPLARATRELVADKTLRSRLDVDLVLEFRVPPARLRAGRHYVVTLDFLDPYGEPHPFPMGSTAETGTPLSMRSTPLNLDRITIPGRVAESDRGPLAHALEVANPGMLRFPKDDPDDCQARSVWCLRAFGGRVYVGYGDWAKNRGPIDVWSFAPVASDPTLKARYGRYAFEAGDDPRLLFTREYTVQEHAIEEYRTAGDRLLLPGIDGLKEQGPDGILFGNLYIREKGFWRKVSSLPGARHVFDIAEVGRRLIATAEMSDSIVASDDGGLSWRPIALPDTHPQGRLVPYAGGVLILGLGEAWHFKGDGPPRRHRAEYTPGPTSDNPHRVTPFRGGLVYTTWDSWGRTGTNKHPLFFLDNLDEGPRLIEPFRDKNVRDILAEGSTLYVLTGAAAGGRFNAEVHATTDLKGWVRLAAVEVPAMPNAFARLDGRFFVGLANRGYAAGHNDRQVTAYAFADRAAGSIWMLKP
jgi:hypothetical protein